jgi:hypothetical protein
LFIYGPLNALANETALPKLMLAASWLHEAKLNVPAVQLAVWLLLWLIDEDEVALVLELGSDDPACAAETALPLLKFIAAWLHEKLFDVPAVHVAL